MSISFYAEDCFADTDPEVNLSNGNAAMILRSLGIEFGWGGSIAPEDLLSAIEGADPIDSGAPAVELGARWIEGAIRPGYHADVYSRLMEVAEFARAHHAQVIWS